MSQYVPAEDFVSNAEFLGKLISDSPNYSVVSNGKKEVLYNIPAGFDIETSSFYYQNEKTAIMYEWTFGINNIITYGRTWEQLKILLHAVSTVLQTNPTKRLVVYVHNLPYEFQFIRKHFSWTKIFFLDSRKPVYAITDSGIEFRCSLKLSGKSLAATAKDLTKYKAEKMAGDLDYTLIRHPNTTLTPKELEYCFHDVKVILNYIQEKIEQDGNIARIPLTQTGYVRRYCKDACFPEEQVWTNASTYAEDEIDAIGVSRDERMLSGWLHARECPPSREIMYEGWLIRLYKFLSYRYGNKKVSDCTRKVSWFS